MLREFRGKQAVGDGRMSNQEQRSRAAVVARVAPLARRSSLLWQSGAASSKRPGMMRPASRQLQLLGLDIDNVDLECAAADLAGAGRLAHARRVVFVNAHVMNCAWADRAYWDTVASADVRYADGSGMAVAARLAGDTLNDNVNGTDLLPLLADQAVKNGVTIFLLGGSPGAAAGSAATIAAQGLPHAIAGTHHGFFEKGSVEEDAVIDRINASGAAILLVGMGVPLQDCWIERNAHRIKVPVQVGVGGLFDFFSGRVSRAPVVLRTLGLEWTWRLAEEPGRMWRRYIIGNVTFLARAAVLGMKSRWHAKVTVAT